MKKERSKITRTGLESQDDIGYLTGRRPPAEEEKQIKTPNPRRSSKNVRLGRKDEEDGKDR